MKLPVPLPASCELSARLVTAQVNLRGLQRFKAPAKMDAAAALDRALSARSRMVVQGVSQGEEDVHSIDTDELAEVMNPG